MQGLHPAQAGLWMARLPRAAGLSYRAWLAAVPAACHWRGAGPWAPWAQPREPGVGPAMTRIGQGSAGNMEYERENGTRPEALQKVC